MTDKELHQLRRGELLELMVSLSEENEALRNKIELLNKQLDDRTIQMQESGSIAEVALKISGVFEAAQDAADRYLGNVRQLNDRAQKNSDALMAATQQKCAAMEAETQQNVDQKWNSIKGLLDRYCETHEELKDQIGSFYIGYERLEDVGRG